LDKESESLLDDGTNSRYLNTLSAGPAQDEYANFLKSGGDWKCRETVGCITNRLWTTKQIEDDMNEAWLPSMRSKALPDIELRPYLKSRRYGPDADGSARIERDHHQIVPQAIKMVVILKISPIAAGGTRRDAISKLTWP
jgi:hypothetical protein